MLFCHSYWCWDGCCVWVVTHVAIVVEMFIVVVIVFSVVASVVIVFAIGIVTSTSIPVLV